MRAVVTWREAIGELLRAAYAAASPEAAPDPDDLADHVFVTFEGAYLLCRSLGSPEPMRRQLQVLRQLVAALLSAS